MTNGEKATNGEQKLHQKAKMFKQETPANGNYVPERPEQQMKGTEGAWKSASQRSTGRTRGQWQKTPQNLSKITGITTDKGSKE